MSKKSTSTIDWRFIVAQASTGFRVVCLVTFFAAALEMTLHRFETFLTLSLSLGLAAAIDAVDGFVARRLHRASPFGALFDQLTDRILYATVTPMLAWLALIEKQWFHSKLLLVMAAWFLFRDHLASSLQIHDNERIRNRSWISMVSKCRSGICYFVLWSACYVLSAPTTWQIAPVGYLYALEVVAIVVTAMSIVQYIWVYRPLLAEMCQPDEK